MSSSDSPFYEEFRAEADDLLGQIRRLLGGVRAARGVAQRDLISALLKGGNPAATEMRKHLQELEQSLVQSPKPVPRPLRDAFARYREPPVAVATIPMAATPDTAALSPTP